MTAPKARVDNAGNVWIEASLIGDCRSYTYELLMDTGFTGDVAVPLDIAVYLGLVKAGVANVLLADGSVVSQPVFTGSVQLGDRIYDAVYIVLGGATPLIGQSLISQYKICVDIQNYEVTIEESEEASRPYKVSLIQRLIRMMER